jgi:hyperosmotically inducible protein
MATWRPIVACWTVLALLASPAVPGFADEPPPPPKAAPKAEPKTESKADAKPETKPADQPKESKAPEPEKKGREGEKTQGSNGLQGGSLILAVKLALMADPRLFPYEIEVDLKDHEAVLSGAVSNEEERAAAAEIAQRIDGVKTVANRLRIAKDLTRALSHRRDELISQHVKERFKKSRTLESAGFDVKTEEGIVSLSGRTRFQVIVLEAAEAARQVPGVKAVRTELVKLEPPEEHK